MLIIHCGSGILMRKVATVPAVISCSTLTSLNLLGSQDDMESDILLFSKLSEIVFDKYEHKHIYQGDKIKHFIPRWLIMDVLFKVFFGA